MTRNEAQQLAAAIERIGAWNVYVSGSDAHAIINAIDPLTLDARRIVEVDDATALLGDDLLHQLFVQANPGNGDDAHFLTGKEMAALLDRSSNGNGDDARFLTGQKPAMVQADDWAQLELAL